VSIDGAKQSFYTVNRSILDDEGDTVRSRSKGEPTADAVGTEKDRPNQMVAGSGSQVRTVHSADDAGSRGGDFEERAAILEYDHGLTREEAERLARNPTTEEDHDD
jgi:hypothetical protein